MKNMKFLKVMGGMTVCLGLVALLSRTAFAESVVGEAAEAAQWGAVFAFFGAAIATFLSGVGSAIGVSMTGQAGAGLLTEKPELTGRVITLQVLPGSQGLYGMVAALLFLFNFGDVISGDIQLTLMQDLALFAAFLPIAVTGLLSSPYQAKVCAAGMHMIAKDEKLTGRVITMAALVETYALLGFLITFFMLNTLQGAIIG